MTNWIKVRDGGKLYYDADFYLPEEADSLLVSLLANVEWRQESVRGRNVPRLNAWFSDPGINYSYSGITHAGCGWSEKLTVVKSRVEETSETVFNSVLLNRYRDGQDSIGFHADNEPELGPDPIVATVSLGGERKFVLKHKRTKESVSYQLKHGSLLVMGQGIQQYWIHAVPKTKMKVAERISLTFRRIFVDKAV